MRLSLAAGLLALAACSSSGTPAATAKKDTLTTRQRDSVIGASKIPGAQGVKSAMKVTDSINAHVAALDTVGQ
jgi:hypothetical protein